MAVDKKNEKQVLDRLSFMDDSINVMEDVSAIQETVFKELSRLLIKELDVDINGNIKRTRKNQKAAQKMGAVRNLVLTPAYRKKVGGFIGGFDTVNIQVKDRKIVPLFVEE